MHMHSSPLSLAARLHWCHTICSCYINNGWTFTLHWPNPSLATSDFSVWSHLFYRVTFLVIFGKLLLGNHSSSDFSCFYWYLPEKMEISISDIASKHVIIVNHVLYITLISFKSLCNIYTFILSNTYDFKFLIFLLAHFNLKHLSTYSIKEFPFYISPFSCYKGKEPL